MPKALVIDDEPDVTWLVARFLAKVGFEVEGAQSGKEGLQKAIAIRPDVILLDLMMPDLDGYEVCRRLRNDPRTARIAIMVLSARSQPVDRQMSVQAGADMHLVKPFDGRNLARQVVKLVTDKPVPAPRGGQIVVLPMKPGIGATTVAANLAVGLAQMQGRLPVAVDLGDPDGRLSSALGIKIQRLRAEALQDEKRLAAQPDRLVECLVRHQSGLFVLPARSIAPKPGMVELALSLLRTWCDYVVVDTPVALGALAPVVLQPCSVVLLLFTSDAAVVRAAQMSMAAITRRVAGPVAVWPVLCGARAEWEASRAELEQSLGIRVAAVLPWSPEACAEAEASQTSVILGQPSSPLARAMRGLTERVARLPAGGQGGMAS